MTSAAHDNGHYGKEKPPGSKMENKKSPEAKPPGHHQSETGLNLFRVLGLRLDELGNSSQFNIENQC